jgi:hypothetical protein
MPAMRRRLLPMTEFVNRQHRKAKQLKYYEKRSTALWTQN